MFTTTEDLKSFILWARAQKIQQVQVGDVVVVFSGLALVEDEFTPISNVSEPKSSSEERDTSKTLADEPDASADDDELLFWSSKG